MKLTNERQQQIEMLISFFNMKAGTRFKFGAEKNLIAGDLAITTSDENINEIKDFFREGISNNELEDFELACYKYVDNKRISNKIKAEKEAKEKETLEQNVETSMNLMGKVISEMLAQTKLVDIEASLNEKIEQKAREFIANEYGPIERKVNVIVGERKVQLNGVTHEKFETVLKFVQAKEPVFLTGPAGSGKNVLCKQIAETLGLDFYFSNAVTQEYKITGFTDAMGIYHESQFYKAFKDGGLFMLDEMDASIPEVLIILNSAIANGYFDFPAPIGYVEAHENFRVIGAGNTFGSGATYTYSGRNQLDGASLDRFAVVNIDYSKQIENSLTGDIELLKFIREFRYACESNGINHIVSYRTINRLDKLKNSIPMDELLRTCLIKNLEKDDVNMILDSLSENKWKEGLRNA